MAYKRKRRVLETWGKGVRIATDGQTYFVERDTETLRKFTQYSGAYHYVGIALGLVQPSLTDRY